MTSSDKFFSAPEKPNELTGTISQIGFVPNGNTINPGHFVVRLEEFDRTLRFSWQVERKVLDELAMAQRGDSFVLRYSGGLNLEFVEPTSLVIKPVDANPEPVPKPND